MTRWDPAYDPILLRLHREGQTDYGIKTLMLDQGYPVDSGDVRKARRRLKLKPNRVPAPTRQERPPAPEKPNPLAEAKSRLDGRLVEKTEGGKSEYRLDGRPVRLDEIMRECNRILAARGEPQIVNNPLWEIKP